MQLMYTKESTCKKENKTKDLRGKLKVAGRRVFKFYPKGGMLPYFEELMLTLGGGYD